MLIYKRKAFNEFKEINKEYRNRLSIKVDHNQYFIKQKVLIKPLLITNLL